MNEPPREPGGNGTSLRLLTPGQRGVITALEGDRALMRRLMELGLVPGTEVEVVRYAPMGDPVELRVRGVHLSLRRSEAEHIHVELR